MGNARLAQAIAALAVVRGVLTAATGGVARGATTAASIAAARDSADGSGFARGHAVVDIEMAINEDSPLLYYTHDPDLSVDEEFDPLEMV
ncbi:hypothetical protein V6N13_058661 [Hibiscus sabdariffa]|uniref:Uncharacterized protein n=1 Tax=Hibiscus sabdariffa TaxID=183260 RepID=A0ABR2GFZ6_9ROSI